jgi:hypothetical protein
VRGAGVAALTVGEPVNCEGRARQTLGGGDSLARSVDGEAEETGGATEFC